MPFLIAAPLPFLQSPEGVASAALILRGRYDVRGELLATSMALRLTGLAVGAHFGVDEAIAGMVIAQAVATVILALVARAAFRRFPAAPVEHLGEDRRGVLRSSSIRASPRASSRSAARSRRCSSASSRSRCRSGSSASRRRRMQGLASLSAPARLILLTEQTRDWARGATDAVFRGRPPLHDRRGAADGVVVPPVFVLMPWLVKVLYGADYAGAANAARLVLIAGGAPVRLRLVEVVPGLDRPAEPARRSRTGSSRSC